jgi:ketosteroid isomerase-like protein
VLERCNFRALADCRGNMMQGGISMPAAVDCRVSEIIASWSAAFAKLDSDALSSLYSKSALFYGSNPTLYRGRDGVRSYFAGLPRWKTSSVRFTDVATSAAGNDPVNMAGTANFAFDGQALTVKITWVIIHEDSDWKIVSHHVSSKALLI